MNKNHPIKTPVFKNHSCLMFNYCDMCNKKFCNTCEACKCDEKSMCCKTYSINQYCDACNERICNKCKYEDSMDVNGSCNALCRNCFMGICKLCEMLECTCRPCVKCSKRTKLSCLCGEGAICHECTLLSSPTCSDTCCVRNSQLCPTMPAVLFDFNKHRCPECYNVFIDPRPGMKKRLMATLIIMRREQMPKPIALLICSLLAEYHIGKIGEKSDSEDDYSDLGTEF